MPFDISPKPYKPLHPARPHSQARSGVFSIASHSTLQYFPAVTVQEQTGCAYFLLSLAAIAVSAFMNNSTAVFFDKAEARNGLPDERGCLFH